MGKYIPDVCFHTFNHQGYGVHFFYPYFLNDPAALLWHLTGRPVTAVLLFNAAIHWIGLAIAYDTYLTWQGKPLPAFIFAILYIFGVSGFNINLLKLTMYNQYMAFIWLPWVMMGISQLICGNHQKWMKRAVLGVTLLTLTHVLTLFFCMVYAAVLFLSALMRRQITRARVICWVKAILILIPATAIFTFPMLEQRMANAWLKVPAQNLKYRHQLSYSLRDGSGLFTKWNGALNFSNILFLLLIIVVILLIYDHLLDRTLFKCAIGMGTILVLQSHLIPWNVLDHLALIDMIQMLWRLDGLFYLFAAFAIAYGFQKLWAAKSPSLGPKPFIIMTAALYLVFASQNFYPVKDILHRAHAGNPAGRTQTVTPVTLSDALSHPSFSENEKLERVYLVNGFYDYRAKGQVVGDQTRGILHAGDFQIENHRSLYPNPHAPADQKIQTNLLIENAILIDGKRALHHFSQRGQAFYIRKLPKGSHMIQTPITYLRGFKAFDENGKVLRVQKNATGFLAIPSKGTGRIKITYEKTTLHKIAIGLSMLTWVMVASTFLFRKKATP
ncbi:hypothetical protein [Pseudoramibacter faecis]|uniref:M61 family metallopeptidase n=1 Tax=Pseudoramibacter faecis TaxID=3108534 RepID=UPI002E783BC2|nr:hypothetical protein [Pseudoramibacter sp. HA2172]